VLRGKEKAQNVTVFSIGANYVNISHPGLFTERPPYVVDEQVQANLDCLFEMALMP